MIRNYGALSANLEDAVRDLVILANSANGVKLPRKIRKEKKYLTVEQLHGLAKASKKQSAVVLTLGYLGLRWGEAAGFRVRDSNPLRKLLKVEQNAVTVGGKIMIGTPKTRRTRAIAVPAALAGLLAAQSKDRLPDEVMFPGRDGPMRTINSRSAPART